MRPPKKETMKFKENRLDSFEKPITLPNSEQEVAWSDNNSPDLVSDLVESGFYYSPVKSNLSRVLCSFCHKPETVGKKANVATITTKHYEKNESCILAVVVKSAVTREKFTSWDDRYTFWENEDLKILSAPFEPDARKFRLASYGKIFPLDSKKDFIPNSKSLSKAGFIYTPLNSGDDRVFCIYCGCTLDQWEKEDIPVDEHRMNFPDCYFVRLLKANELSRDNSLRERSVEPSESQEIRVRPKRITSAIKNMYLGVLSDSEDDDDDEDEYEETEKSIKIKDEEPNSNNSKIQSPGSDILDINEGSTIPHHKSQSPAEQSDEAKTDNEDASIVADLNGHSAQSSRISSPRQRTGVHSTPAFHLDSTNKKSKRTNHSKTPKNDPNDDYWNKLPDDDLFNEFMGAAKNVAASGPREPRASTFQDNWEDEHKMNDLLKRNKTSSNSPSDPLSETSIKTSERIDQSTNYEPKKPASRNSNSESQDNTETLQEMEQSKESRTFKGQERHFVEDNALETQHSDSIQDSQILQASQESEIEEPSKERADEHVDEDEEMSEDSDDEISETSDGDNSDYDESYESEFVPDSDYESTANNSIHISKSETQPKPKKVEPKEEIVVRPKPVFSKRTTLDPQDGDESKPRKLKKLKIIRKSHSPTPPMDFEISTHNDDEYGENNVEFWEKNVSPALMENPLLKKDTDTKKHIKLEPGSSPIKLDNRSVGKPLKHKTKLNIFDASFDDDLLGLQRKRPKSLLDGISLKRSKMQGTILKKPEALTISGTLESPIQNELPADVSVSTEINNDDVTMQYFDQNKSLEKDSKDIDMIADNDGIDQNGANFDKNDSVEAEKVIAGQSSDKENTEVQGMNEDLEKEKSFSEVEIKSESSDGKRDSGESLVDQSSKSGKRVLAFSTDDDYSDSVLYSEYIKDIKEINREISRSLEISPNRKESDRSTSHRRSTDGEENGQSSFKESIHGSDASTSSTENSHRKSLKGGYEASPEASPKLAESSDEANETNGEEERYQKSGSSETGSRVSLASSPKVSPSAESTARSSQSIRPLKSNSVDAVENSKSDFDSLVGAGEPRTKEKEAHHSGKESSGINESTSSGARSRKSNGHTNSELQGDPSPASSEPMAQYTRSSVGSHSARLGEMGDLSGLEASTPRKSENPTDAPNSTATTSTKSSRWVASSVSPFLETLNNMEGTSADLKELTKSQNDLHDDYDSELTNFISAMPENEEAMTIHEWIRHTAANSKNIVKEYAGELIAFYEREYKRALDILHALPTDGL